MPELPEAEASRCRIAGVCLNRTIESVSLGDDTPHVELPGGNERTRLVGHQITEARRRGKLILAGSKIGPSIGVHLGMTGSLRPYGEGDSPPDHTKLIIAFEDDRRSQTRLPQPPNAGLEPRF